MSDGSIRITPAARQHDMGDLLGELRELKWHYMELIEATPTREIDPEPIRARAKISAYSDIAAVLDELLKKYGG
jgi:hypothetical protein